MRIILLVIVLWTSLLSEDFSAEEIEAARSELREIARELSPLSRAMNLIHRTTGPSVVSIKLTLQKFDPFSRFQHFEEVQAGEGSGFVFHNGKGVSYIITNAHVVLQQKRNKEFLRDYRNRFVPFDTIRVETHDGHLTEATFIGADDKTDLAVLAIDIPDLPPVIWGDSENVLVGDQVMALGYPLGVGYSASAGIISATDRSTGVYSAQGGFESFYKRMLLLTLEIRVGPC